MDVLQIARQLQTDTIKLRRELHMYPEMPFEEKRTCDLICRELSSYGIPYEVVGKYNVIGKLQFGEGKTLVIRADIDALPIQENLDVPWKSKHDGVMHACGHDAHTAMLLSTAKGLLDMKNELTGTVYFCFQEAEEIGGCADECVDYLQRQGKIDGAIAIHVQSKQPIGTIDAKEGARCSGAEVFYIDIEGSGGHGSRPDLAIDPINIACEISQRLKQIPLYQHNLFDTSLISICMISSGNRYNVIPDTAHIEGTVRYFKLGDGDILFEKIENTVQHIVQFYGATASVKRITAAKYPVINDKFHVELANLAAHNIGLQSIDAEAFAGSDNFAEFLHAFSGCYCNLGTMSTREGAINNLHNANFDLDESALEKGVAFFLEYCKQFFQL